MKIPNIIKKDLLDDTPSELYTFTWLNSDNELSQYLTIPPGVIREFTVFNHTIETNHETVGFRVLIDDAIIYPTLSSADATGGTRHWIYTGLYRQVFPVKYPLFEEVKLSVELNAMPTNGLSVIINHMPHDQDRKLSKTVYTEVSK